MNPRNGKHRQPINRRSRIAHPLHIPNPVVIEKRFRPLRRPQVHEYRSYTTLIQLALQTRHITDSLPQNEHPKCRRNTSSTGEASANSSKTRSRLRTNRSQRPRHLIEASIPESTIAHPLASPGSNKPHLQYLRRPSQIGFYITRNERKYTSRLSPATRNRAHSHRSSSNTRYLKTNQFQLK